MTTLHFTSFSSPNHAEQVIIKKYKYLQEKLYKIGKLRNLLQKKN